MKKLSLALFLLLTGTQVFAEKWSYTSAKTAMIANEKEMVMCAPAPDDAGECYELTISKYNNMIREIRSQNSAKLDARLWQAINLNYKNAIDSCRSINNLGTSRMFFYPYQDCLTNHLHNLLVATIELHLK